MVLCNRNIRPAVGIDCYVTGNISGVLRIQHSKWLGFTIRQIPGDFIGTEHIYRETAVTVGVVQVIWSTGHFEDDAVE